ncbi:MAG: hypothetical protein BWY77_00906 [bacterium ADurb.Bin431]|nr:MAG: hypothetical protein BWY77_00906 [bacterium ADurb.Bin431]
MAFAHHHGGIPSHRRLGETVDNLTENGARAGELFLLEEHGGVREEGVGGIGAARIIAHHPLEVAQGLLAPSAALLHPAALEEGRRLEVIVPAFSEKALPGGQGLFVPVQVELGETKTVEGVVGIAVVGQGRNHAEGLGRLFVFPLAGERFADEILRLAAPPALRPGDNGARKLSDRFIVLFAAIAGHAEAEGGLLGERTGGVLLQQPVVGGDRLIPAVLPLTDVGDGEEGIVRDLALGVVRDDLAEIADRLFLAAAAQESLTIPVAGIRIEGAGWIVVHEAAQAVFGLGELVAVDLRLADAEGRLVPEGQGGMALEQGAVGGDGLLELALLEKTFAEEEPGLLGLWSMGVFLDEIVELVGGEFVKLVLIELAGEGEGLFSLRLLELGGSLGCKEEQDQKHDEGCPVKFCHIFDFSKWTEY